MEETSRLEAKIPFTSQEGNLNKSSHEDHFGI
jgi:hypothetical protein